jgi:hypothetical protein
MRRLYALKPPWRPPSITSKMSASLRIARSSPSINTPVPGPFAEQHAITRLDGERDDPAGFVRRTCTNREHLALDRFFLGRIGDDDSAGSLFLGLDASYQEAVAQTV